MKRWVDSVKIKQASRGSVHIRMVNILLVVLAVVISVALLSTIGSTMRLVQEIQSVQGAVAGALEALILRQQVLAILLLAVLLLCVLSVTVLILLPMRGYIAQIQENRELTMRGAYELRYLAEAYNLMYEENRKHQESLRYRAEHDHLTGLLNRGAFETLRRDKEHDSIALLLIDVDMFKSINDNYGHDVGDRVLQKVAGLLAGSFRASDYPCRIGGDEFAVIMTDMNPSLKQAVLNKIEFVSAGLKNTADGLPAATLSIGVAFSRQCRPEDDIFKLADAAQYRIKGGGRNGCAFYDPELDKAAPSSRPAD